MENSVGGRLTCRFWAKANTFFWVIWVIWVFWMLCSFLLSCVFVLFTTCISFFVEWKPCGSTRENPCPLSSTAALLFWCSLTDMTDSQSPQPRSNFLGIHWLTWLTMTDCQSLQPQPDHHTLLIYSINIHMAQGGCKALSYFSWLFCICGSSWNKTQRKFVVPGHGYCCILSLLLWCLILRLAR